MSKVVSIIGGGPAGFATARALLHEPGNFAIRILERQTSPGGVWVYNGKGPMYQDLDTNIYKELMEYRDRPLPSNLPCFVDRTDVLKYVEQYSREVEDHQRIDVRWGSSVTNLVKQDDKWHITLDNGSVEISDFVAVATGHYEHPYYPAIPGLSELRQQHPTKVTHTRFYTKPQPFADQRVLVIGNGSSGTDIVIQLLSVCSSVDVSRRHEAKSDHVFEDGVDVNWKPEIAKISSAGEVEFKDGSHDTYDVLLFATGYLYKLPFLSEALKSKLVHSEEMRVRNLYKYTFFIDDPSLTFVGFNKQVVPMPLCESQAAVIARVWSRRLDLPDELAMQSDEAEIISQRGDGSGYFSLGYPADVQFMHMLNDWADQAGPEGFKAERWGPEKVQMRSEIGEKKLGEYARKKKEAVKHRKAKHA